MLSSNLLSLLVCLVFASSVAAHLDWVNALPKCWQKCLKATSDGCAAKSCICEASQSLSYLSSAISCMKSSCDSDGRDIDSDFIFAVNAYCDLVGNSIPDKIISSAYVQATATSVIENSTKDGGDLKSTVTTTLTKTTTDEDGNTLQIIIPIVIGPKTTSTGKIVTSTLDSEATATDSPSSAAASPSPTAGPAATSTQAQEVATPTSAQKADPPASGNGSPFENMQAGAGHWSVSRALLAVGTLAGLFMRL